MTASLTGAQLLDVAGRYWYSDEAHYLRQERGPEAARREALWEQALAKLGRWRELLRSMGARLPGYAVGDGTSPSSTSCFRCIAYLPDESESSSVRWAVVGCASILAPVQIVYGVRKTRVQGRAAVPEWLTGPLPEPLARAADVMGQVIEAEWGAEPLPWELARRPVPLFVEWKAPPETTLFHALFTASPEVIP
jgi:hypothetical protein